MWNRYWWFSDFFEVLWTVRLWPKSYLFQTMHRLMTPKSKTFWGQDSSLFGWLRIQKSAFFASHVIVWEWRILRKIELKQLWKCCWIDFHEYTVKCWHSKTGIDRISKCPHFTEKMWSQKISNTLDFWPPNFPKIDKILSTRSFRFWGHQSMHVLKKVWFWSKSHCTEDLKKVQKSSISIPEEKTFKSRLPNFLL